MVRVWKQFGALQRSRRGASTVEFAVAAPVMLALLTGAVELSYLALARSTLEDSVRQAARFGLTGSTGGVSLSREAQLAAIIDAQMGSLVSRSTIDVTYKAYPSMAGVGQPEPFTDTNGNGVCNSGETYREVNGVPGWQADMGRAGSMGGPGDVIVYTVTFKYPPLVPYFSFLGDSNGDLTLTARAVSRNQIWQKVTPGTQPTLNC